MSHFYTPWKPDIGLKWVNIRSEIWRQSLSQVTFVTLGIESLPHVSNIRINNLEKVASIRRIVTPIS